MHTGDGILFIKFDDIIYLKADGSYTHFIADNHSKITVSKRIADYEKLEQIGPFIRIHRSHIINYNRIQKIVKQDGGSVIMDNKEQLSISSNKKIELLKLFERHKL